MAKSYQISKSSYIRGKQCLKSVYLYKFYNQYRDPLPEARKIRFEKGHDIGKLACLIFPEGIDASPSYPGKYDASVRLTADLITNNEPVIYEAAFISEGVLCALDILVNSGGWHAYEVKSSEKISDTYLEDAALQYNVITGTGLQLNDFSIIHLKKPYMEINGNEKLDELFQFTSVIDECIRRQIAVKEKLAEIKNILAAPSVPTIKRGEQCHNPYECDFIGWCTKQEEEVKEGLFK